MASSASSSPSSASASCCTRTPASMRPATGSKRRCYRSPRPWTGRRPRSTMPRRRPRPSGRRLDRTEEAVSAAAATIIGVRTNLQTLESVLRAVNILGVSPLGPAADAVGRHRRRDPGPRLAHDGDRRQPRHQSRLAGRQRVVARPARRQHRLDGRTAPIRGRRGLAGGCPPRDPDPVAGPHRCGRRCRRSAPSSWASGCGASSRRQVARHSRRRQAARADPGQLWERGRSQRPTSEGATAFSTVESSSSDSAARSTSLA